VWWWVLVWFLVILASLAVFAALAVMLFRKGVALAGELETASVRFSAVTDRLDELARAFTPEPSAVFEDPAAVRRRQGRARQGRHRKGRAESFRQL
jgi:hypothetical protein